MTATLQLPSASDLTELMGDLFGLDVKTGDCPDEELYSIAEYRNEDGEAIGYMACDLAGGCRLGAALTQVPAGAVDEAIREKAMPESLSDNLDEVFNISVNLFVPTDGVRVVLDRVAHGSGSEHFADLKAKLDAASTTEFGMDISRYGTCRFVIGS